jgi:peptidoglycan hydrolase-like amidase
VSWPKAYDYILEGVLSVVLIDKFKSEPVIRVGLLTGVPAAQVSFSGSFMTSSGSMVAEGAYTATQEDGGIVLGGAAVKGDRLVLSPVDPARGRFTVRGITIGIEFHWERQESQTFQGALSLVPSQDGINVINEVPLEAYLTSVISSEMSASSPGALLRAHAIVSRSWLLFQLCAPASRKPDSNATHGDDQIIRWYDRESHSEFDVCADDHCQRYQGITKAHSAAAFQAVLETRGHVLVFGGQICDARYSKSCGGMTESYSSAWQDRSVPYLEPVYDGPGETEGFALPLTDEVNARRWITSSPAAFCNVTSADLLARVLPGFDQETRDFYRWQAEYSPDEISELLSSRLGIDFGAVLGLDAARRGDSGRIVHLRITGSKRSMTIGKELEIRRALSRSHLYSSAFVVEKETNPSTGRPAKFKLSGAGWGHGVGLCQIGAAAMAEAGYHHHQILSHYFKGASVATLY